MIPNYLRLYLKHGNYRAIEEETGIPYSSCFKNIQKSLGILKRRAIEGVVSQCLIRKKDCSFKVIKYERSKSSIQLVDIGSNRSWFALRMGLWHPSSAKYERISSCFLRIGCGVCLVEILKWGSVKTFYLREVYDWMVFFNPCNIVSRGVLVFISIYWIICRLNLFGH